MICHVKTKAQLARALQQPEQIILVAKNQAGQVIGYAHAASYDCLYFPPLLNLLALAVDKDFQGQGYGKALMQAIREEGVAAGYTGIRINSGISRMKAHEFYRKLGCEEKADQKRFYWEF
ncbi:putative acetyltransferase [Streptococcus intermedius]|uniref:Acetyltransferase n=1 Tax=Streptococcus intermedius TaxID=1338 RepID=A0AAE8KB18_STRIT|nr:putative acetyltransferase [Streptococcus intermedius]